MLLRSEEGLPESGWQNKVASVKRDWRQDAHLIFFKYKFLNALRDELGLTLYREKVTLLHLLMLIAPIAGIAAGIGFGQRTHDLLKEIIGGIVGLVIGIAISWPLPRLLWKILLFFAQKGWFLQSERHQNVPVMTSDEFASRVKALEREDFRWGAIWPIVLFLGLYFFGEKLGDYLERTKALPAIKIMHGLAVIGFVIGCIVLWCWSAKRRFRKHGLLCPACARKITDTAGLFRIPHMGLCKHCGAKIIETKG